LRRVSSRALAEDICQEAFLRTYNTTVRHLIAAGQAPEALFAPLPDDANLTDVAVSSAQLAEYLRADLPEEEQERERAPKISRNFTIGNLNLGHGADSDELGQMIRDHLAEWFGEARPKTAEGSSEAPEATPPPQAGRAGGETPRAARASLPPQPARVEELRTEPQGTETRR
jgi:hypothetical protein